MLRGIINLQTPDYIDEHLEILTGLRNFRLKFVGLGDLGHFIDPTPLHLGPFAVGVERILLEQEIHTTLRQYIDLFLHLVQQGTQHFLIHVTHFIVQSDDHATEAT